MLRFLSDDDDDASQLHPLITVGETGLTRLPSADLQLSHSSLANIQMEQQRFCFPGNNKIRPDFHSLAVLLRPFET